MNSNSWQHPYVNIFKYFDIGSSKKCLKQGDVSTLVDRDLKSIVYRIRGLIPANNYIQFPSQVSTQNLGLTGRLFYVLFRPIYDKNFCIHIDVLTSEQKVIRISLSNLYREFKLTQALIQFPYMTTGTDIHWSVLCLDLKSILLTYMSNQHYHMIKSFQLCGNMLVKNCFTSQFLYEPGIDNDTAKRTGLTRAGICSFPRELSYPYDKGQTWHDKYDFIIFPNTSSLMGKNQHEPFDKVGNVRLPTPRKLKVDNENSDEFENDQMLPLTVQTTVVNGHMSRSITDLAHVTHRSRSLADNQLNWRTYDNHIEHFPSLPTINDTLIKYNGVHLFINSKSTSSSTVSKDDFNYDLASTNERSLQTQVSCLLPDPILRLNAVIGSSIRYNNAVWTQDGNFIIYSSDAVVVQLHIDSQQQVFFIGHTDKISGISFNNNQSLLATIQTGFNAILRLWKFESRRCICAIRVLNAHNLHAIDFSIGNASSIVVIGENEQSHKIVCVYNASNAIKGSIELLSHAIINLSITHVRFIPYETTKFITIGIDNIQFWRINNENNLKSIKILSNDQDKFEYTDLQFEYLSNNKINESIIYISTKTGEIFELSHKEKSIKTIHYLSNKLKSNLSISALSCTNNYCITGSNDGFVRVWSKDFSQVYIEAKYDQKISAVVSSSDQTRIFVSTESCSLNILNLVTKLNVNLCRTHAKYVNDLDYDPNKNQMITAGHDGTIRLWNLNTNKQLLEFTSEREIPLIIAYKPSRQSFACGFNTGTIKIFDLDTSTIINQVKHNNSEITALLYSHNELYLINCDDEGNLYLSDPCENYRLLKTLSKTVKCSNKGVIPLSISPDGKYIVFVGPSEFLITVIETNSLNQMLQIDIHSCTRVNPDESMIKSSESALLARFISNQHILVATTYFNLLKFDSYSGKLFNLADNVYKDSFDSLSISSDNQYLITGGDNLLKYWNAKMNLDINFQSFVGHSGKIKKLFFTHDNMQVISVADSILIWDVLAWNKSRPKISNNAQCIVPPQSLMTKILEHGTVQSDSSDMENSDQNINEQSSSRTIVRSLSNLEINRTAIISQVEKKLINKKLLKQKFVNKMNVSPPTIQRHFIQRINHSQLAKKRYVPAVNQEILKLQSIIGYNGSGRENLVWYPPTGFFAFTVSCNIVVENLNTNQQTVLTGHNEEISTITLSNDGSILVSAQCSISTNKDDLQSKIILWNVQTFEQKLCFYQSVYAIQTISFSKDDQFLISIGNYRKPMLTIWSTKNNYSHLIDWQDNLSSCYINCLAWNSIRSNEFCLGCSHNTVRFCTINSPINHTNECLNINNQQIPILYIEHKNISSDITSCVYLVSNANLVLCATNSGLITCWNSRLCLYILNWKADTNEICFMTTIKSKLLIGTSTGYLKLWNIEKLESILGQVNSTDSNYGLFVENEFELDGGIVSGSFDNVFDMGIVGTSCGSLWYICWNEDRSATRLVTSHSDEIIDLLPIEDTHIVTSSRDGTMRIFQLEDRNEILRFNIDGSKITCLISWESTYPIVNNISQLTNPIENLKLPIQSIVSGHENGTLRIFNLMYGQNLFELQVHKSAITIIHIPLNTQICLTGAYDGTVAISNLNEGQVLRVIHEHSCSAIISMIDSRKLIENNFYIWFIASHDRRVTLWKSNKQFDLCSFIDWLKLFSFNKTNHNYPISQPFLIRFIDNNQLMFIDNDTIQSIKIYRIDQNKIIRTILLNQTCSCFDISNHIIKHRLIAIGTTERLLQIRDYAQETFQDFIGSIDKISNVKFSKTNHFLITTSFNEIFVWELNLN